MMDESKSAMPGTNFSMLQDNGILYRAPSQLSTTVARTYKIEYAQRQSYVGISSPMIFDWNTGTAFVEPSTAILSFTVIVTNSSLNDYDLIWGGGLGACNLISEIRIISKNGVELDRTSEAGQLAKILSDYTLSKSGRENAQMCDGFGLDGGITVPFRDTASVDISIPLRLLSGFFRPTIQDMLIPAGLASGLRFEFTLQNPDRAFYAPQGNAVNGEITYAIDSPQMLLQLSDMNDPVQSALFNQSAKTGLEYNFPSYFSSKVSNSGQTRINEQLKKAVSQANKCFAVVLPKETLVTSRDYENIRTSGFNSKSAASVSSFNWRLGSQYYPLQALDKPSKYWAIANACFNRLRSIEWAPNQVDYDNFNVGGKCILSTTLDMSDRINLSGSKINNSSVLELRMELNSTAAVDVILFLQFTAEVRTSGSRSVLKI